MLEIGGSSTRVHSCSFSEEDRRAFIEYRENRTEESGGSMGSVHSLYRLEGETSPLQEWINSHTRRGEGTSSSNFAQLGSIVRSILRVGKRKRVLHDVISGNVDELDNYVSVLKDRGRSCQGGFFIIAKHFKEGWEHLHVVHDCNYYNFQCRCSLLHGMPVKFRRGTRNGKWATELTEEYIYHLTVYLSATARGIIQIKIGGHVWGLSSPVEDFPEIRFEWGEFRQMVDACETSYSTSYTPHIKHLSKTGEAFLIVNVMSVMCRYACGLKKKQEKKEF